MKRVFYISILLIITLSSCFQEDQRLSELPPYQEELETSRGKQGQLYYSLKDRKILESNSVYAWDLAFSCKPGDFTILVNSGKKMGVYNTESRDITASFSEEYRNYQWSYDVPTSYHKGSAIGLWGDFEFANPQSFGDVYVINRGFDRFNLPFRMKKFRIDGIENNAYQISFGEVLDSVTHQLTVPRNDSFNFVYVSLESTGKVMNLEPPKWDWDLLLTTYMDTSHFSNVYTRSDSVNHQYTLYDGILLNPYKVRSSRDTSNRFNDLDFFKAEGLEYSSARNSIGCQWYTWDNQNNQYGVTNKRTFVIRSEDFFYYLIEFKDFEKSHKERTLVKFAVRNL